METTSPRAARTLTPVKLKTIHSRNGHTGNATAQLKSPGTNHDPRTKCSIAAFPYQPSSVYFDQSIHRE